MKCAFLSLLYASLAFMTIHGAEKEVPKYFCETDADCAKNFPDTVCIQVDLYDGQVVKKCTPNTKERPACMGAQPGLCPSYQAPEIEYLNVHCVFVAKDADTDTADAATAEEPAASLTSSDGSGTGAAATRSRFLFMAADTSSKAGSTDGAEVTAPAVQPSVTADSKYAKVSIKNKTVTGIFKCVDVSDCQNQAYDPSTCEPTACQSPNSKTVCNNQGTCTYKSKQQMSKRSCMCYKGFSGEKCQTEVSGECDVDCGLGGDCINGQCKCKKGFNGKSYQGKQGKANRRCTKCTNDLACQNNNTCDIESGKCQCGPGFFGPTCGATEDSCTKKDCGVGTCRVLGNGSSACFCKFCSPDCQQCTEADCSSCPSFASTISVSKAAVIFSVLIALTVGQIV